MSQPRMEKYKKRSGEENEKVRPISFGESQGTEPYNASDIVAVADSRFMFCDNNVGDALFELRLCPDASMYCPLIRRPLIGIEAGAIDDLEGMAIVEQAGRKFIYALPSLSLKKRKKRHKRKKERGKVAPARNSILRISIEEDDRLYAETIPDFRNWLIDNAPELGKSPRYLPDDGGLNVEGLGWDPSNQALILGVRTPVIGGKPLVLRVRVKEIGGPWTLSNFEMLSAVALRIQDAGDEQGVRAIAYDYSRGASLIVLGNSTSTSKARYRLYSWDGNAQGIVRRFDRIRFAKRMRVEGVTPGKVGNRDAIVFVDDTGGYQVVWNDDARLQ